MSGFSAKKVIGSEGYGGVCGAARGGGWARLSACPRCGNFYSSRVDVLKQFVLPVPPPTPLPSLETAIARLSLSLTQLTDSHASSTTTMSNLADEREILEGKEKEMRTMVEEAESKRSWFSSFREWVETVATFLDEKVRIYV